VIREAFLRGSGVLVVAFAMPAPGQAQPAKTSGAAEANPLAGPQYSNVDSWLAIADSGDVTVLFGKAELGTGTRTAIAQLVADELDVPFEHVQVVAPDTARTPNQGYTAGSQTLMSGAIPVRKAAATARLALRELGAGQLGVPVAEVTMRDGACMVTNAPAQRVSYAKLLGGKRIARTIDDNVALQPPGGYRVVGKPIPRVDLPAKVVGSYAYVQNVRVPGMLHGRIIHPPRPGAKLVASDERSLEAIPETITVVRKGDVLGVVAKNEWHAIRAARELKVTWDGGATLPQMSELAEFVKNAPGRPRELVTHGDVDAALHGAKRTLRAVYSWPFQSHGSIGPSCAVADVRAGGATIWSGTQGVFPLRGSIAELLGLPLEKVRVRYAEAAGCYGHNGADDVSAEAALLSQAVKAPVRLQWSRLDETRWDPKGPAMTIELHGALDAKGDVAAWDYRVWTPSHSGRPDAKAGHTLPGILTGAAFGKPAYIGGDRNAPNTYTFAAQRVTIVDQPTAVLRQSALRGLGGTQNTFANESFVDELAHLAGADPIAFRLRHLDDPRAKAVLDAVQRNYARGRGVAFVRYENKGAYVAAVADVAVGRASGVVRVNHIWIAHDCGLIVNPDGLRNQIEGNVVQATSRALKEQVVFAPDGVRSVDWASYPILGFEEVPDVTITLIDRPSEKILGAGEATTTVIAPAIANAVFAQTGARVRSVPFTPQTVLAALARR
jgi:CO/xanthine dehydrogenase Mo-binding subunit